MVEHRDRAHSIMLGDSGGFQVSRGLSDFEKDATVHRILKLMEGVADWPMVLDLPVGGIGPGFMEPHVERLIAEPIANDDDGIDHVPSRDPIQHVDMSGIGLDRPATQKNRVSAAGSVEISFLPSTKLAQGFKIT